ncbi:outer membrane protein transport protein [Aeromonas schubertii]|uniref:Long-chain fatty acid transport protein n=1 Tax=Aeromonas schubertii TaxID=652 RepID=A0A0S2SIN0_9GAMM|nr:outer membrane protein transport protein [Aeromonas schubertii]ALP41568.1 Long-chain fatty acid transport protein [Aeromonas schubertii]
MRTYFKPSVIAFALAASQAHAAGYQLAEQSATGLGRAFAGEAAIADNASVLGRNSGAITRFDAPALSGGLIYLKPDVNIDGQVKDITGTKGANAHDIADAAWIPNLYFVTPLNDRLSLGLSATSHYGLGIEMPQGYDAGHFGNVSEIKTVDLGMALAYRITDMLSFGAGLSLIKGEGEVGGTYPTTLTNGQSVIAKHVEGDGNALGWNAGILLTPSEQTRIGLSYRNGVNLKLKGDATVSKPVAPGKFATISDQGSLILPLPATAELALYQALNERLALHASLNWTDWSKFKSLTAELDHLGTLPIKEEHWEDSWRYALGMTYQLTPKWQLRSGLAYDQSPVPADRRTISIPDADRIWYSAGLGYRHSDALSVDLGLTFIDGKRVSVHESLSQPVVINGQPMTYRSDFNGYSEGDAWLAGVQINYQF